MRDYLFAYGTLQPGFAPAQIASLAAKLRPVGAGFVRGVLYDLERYPGAVPDANASGKIAGTVMELPDDADFLARLDAYEGYDPRAPEASEFVRERQVAELDSGGTVECWFYRYILAASASQVVASGVWRRKGDQGTEGTRERENG